MTTEEFAKDLNRQFDVLYNNVTSNQAPGMNILEKSIVMTKALHQLLAEYFNHRTDVTNAGYDRSEKRQIDFGVLTMVKYLTLVNDLGKFIRLDDRSLVFNAIPEDALYMLNHTLVVPLRGGDETKSEQTKAAEEEGDTEASNDPVIPVITNAKYYNIIPLSYDSYAVAMRKPYKYPPKDCAWMLTSTGGYLEVIAKGVTVDDSPYYRLKYVRKPNPIILGDLTAFGSDVTLEGENNVVDFEFPKEMYHEILERAVTLAKIAWQGSTSTLVDRQNNQK